METKNLIFIGQRGVGKTTLIQVLCGEELHYHKTQTVQVKAHIIDTPGEFLERRSMNRHLLVSSYDADMVVLVEEATAEQMFFPPGFTAMFPLPAIGVITKIDLQPDLERAVLLIQDLVQESRDRLKILLCCRYPYLLKDICHNQSPQGL